MKPLTIQEIRKRFNKEKPKFICLKNDKGQTVVARNNPKINAEKRMKEMEQFFENESTPDGLYYFISKNSLQATSPEMETPVAKGTVPSEVPALRERVIVQTTPTENVWTAKEAVLHLTENERLKLQLEAKEKELQEIKRKQLQENDDLYDDDDEEPGADIASIFSGLKEILPTLADRWFDDRKEARALKARQLDLYERTHLNGATQQQDEEDAPEPAETPEYVAYWDELVQDNDQEAIDEELDLLEKEFPELYQKVCAKYKFNGSTN